MWCVLCVSINYEECLVWFGVKGVRNVGIVQKEVKSLYVQYVFIMVWGGCYCEIDVDYVLILFFRIIRILD